MAKYCAINLNKGHKKSCEYCRCSKCEKKDICEGCDCDICEDGDMEVIGCSKFQEAAKDEK